MKSRLVAVKASLSHIFETPTLTLTITITRMNPSTKTYGEAAPNSPPRCSSDDDRLGVEGLMDAMTAEAVAAVVTAPKHKSLPHTNDHSEFSCKRLSLTSPTKHQDDTSESSSKDCGNDQMSTTSETSHKSNHTNNETMTLKSMFRRSSWNNLNKSLESQTTSNLSLESVSRQRYARRNSYVSDMVVARCGTNQETSKLDEHADALGYNTEEPEDPQRKRRQAASSHDAPPTKRRRYQRRNSFYIPETSRSSAQDSGFSWKAMDFLYGRSETSDHVNKPVASVD